MIAAALNKIRQSARGNVAVGIRILEVLRSVAENAIKSEALAEVDAQAAVVFEGLERLSVAELDAKDVRAAYLEVKETSAKRLLEIETF